MGFHEDLKQSFQNLKEVYIDPLDTGKQDKLTEGAHIKIETTYEFTDITSSSDIVANSSALPASGTADIFYICENNNDVYTWDEDNSEYVKSTTLSAQFVAAKPTTGQNVNKLYVLTGDNSIWSCAAVPNTISADYEIEIASLTTVNSTQTSQIGSLSAENSTQTSEISSLASVTSTHTSELTSLSTSQSELASEYTVLASEVADKQDSLTAGAGISISNNVISANAGISLTVVSTLPTTDISTTTIYLIAKTTAETNDIYDEYVYVNNAWEHIGSTQVDLTNVYTKTQIDSMFAIQSTTNSTLTSEISSLSQSASEIASVASSLSTSVSTHASQLSSLSTENSTQNSSLSSLSTENSTQTSELVSLSTAASELASEYTVLNSEVANKQDTLSAGTGIDITNNVISATGGGGGSTGAWEIIIPTSS